MTTTSKPVLFLVRVMTVVTGVFGFGGAGVLFLLAHFGLWGEVAGWYFVGPFLFIVVGNIDHYLNGGFDEEDDDGFFSYHETGASIESRKIEMQGATGVYYDPH